MSQQSRAAATELLTNYKKKIVEYINGANQGPDNTSYLEYLSRAQPAPDDKISTTVITPAGQAWERHEFTFSCPTRVNFFFMGIAIRSVELNILFPGEIFGPNQVNPHLLFKTQLPRAWLGGFGTYMGPGPVGMYPFDNLPTMAQEIAHNAKENLVDKLCDFINHSNEACARALRANLDYLARKWNFLFEYSVQKGIENKIPVPLYVLYDPATRKSTAVLEVFVRKEMWLPPAEAIMRFLEPLVEAASYFDENGEMFPDGPHYEEDYLLSKIKKQTPGKGNKEDEGGFFTPVKTIQRDEFGYAIGGGQDKKPRKIDKKGAAETAKATLPQDKKLQDLVTARHYLGGVAGAIIDHGIQKRASELGISPQSASLAATGKVTPGFKSHDVLSAGEEVREVKKQQELEYKKRLIKSEAQKQELGESVKGVVQSFKNAQEWFNALQNKRFTVVGDPAALPLKIKGNVSFLLALNPPFILSFARDQLRLKRSLTSPQAQEILFEIFKTGFLQQN